MAVDDKRPLLTLVRPDDRPAQEPLPPVPPPVPESLGRERLKGALAAMGTSLEDAEQLVVIGHVLATGALELRPCMSAQVTRRWLERHRAELDRARHEVLGGAEASYRATADLRHAVMSAATELDEAALEMNAPHIAETLYARAGRPPARPSWWNRVMKIYDSGIDVLGCEQMVM